jgi:hypothetical protein
VNQSKRLKESDLVVDQAKNSPRNLSMDESSIKQGSTHSKHGLDITQEQKIVDLQINNAKQNLSIRGFPYSEMGDDAAHKLSEYGAFGRPSEASHYSKYAKNKAQGKVA